jgi:hypothetical protein
MKLINFRKIGTVLAVAVFGFISFTAGVDLTQNANSAGSSSALPVLKGGTGANNAASARTNLDVYSKGTVDTNIFDSGGIKRMTDASFQSSRQVLYVRLFSNVQANWSYYRNWYLDLGFYASGNFEWGKLLIASAPSTTTANLKSADYKCSVAARNVSSAGGGINMEHAIGLFKNADETYSIWIKLLPGQDVVYGQYNSSREANVLSGNAGSQQKVLLDSATRNEPEGLQGDWIPVNRENCNPPTTTQ